MRERISSAWKCVKTYTKETYDTITIEPNVFLHIFTFGIILGAAVQTNVVLWKICHVIKGHPEELCDDMVYEGGNHSEIKKDVQAYLNDFELYMDFIQAGPAVIYSLFAGALSDRHGSRRPLMLGPMIGWTLSFIIHVVHYAYIRY